MMRKNIIIYVLFLSLLLTILFSVSFVSGATFSKTYTAANNEDSPKIIDTSDGGYAALGRNSASPYRLHLLKVDSTGNEEWNKLFDSSVGIGSQSYSIVEADGGDYFIIGSLTTTLALTKINSVGTVLWSNTYFDVSVASAVASGDGGVVINGILNSDISLIKFNSAGSAVWNQSYGINGVGYDIVKTSDNGYFFPVITGAGTFHIIKTDSSGVLEWRKDFDPPLDSVGGGFAGETSDGGYFAGSVINSADWSSIDAFLIKVDSSGDLEWGNSYGTLNFDIMRDAIQMSNGEYLIVGRTIASGNNNGLIINVDASGNVGWMKIYGSSGHDGIHNIVDAGGGNYLAAGYTDSFGLPNRDFWLFTVDYDGNICTDADYDNVDACNADGSIMLTCGSPCDCDDSTTLKYPGRSEVCDGLDNDCDGVVDEGCGSDCVEPDSQSCGVSTGLCVVGSQSCSGGNWGFCGSGYVGPSAEVCDSLDNDCDGLVDEGYVEVCNGVDDDCDGIFDEGFDVDGDGYTSCGGDCDDNAAGVNPGAVEVCDGLDNDCDGLIDEGVCGGSCVDEDKDKYGVNGDATCQKVGVDCDDGNKFVNLGELELCTTPYDDNCNGQINEGCDADGDGHSIATDCNDDDASIYPGATEVCNNLDDDCVNGVDDGLICDDADGDGIVDGEDICPYDASNACNVNADQELLNSTSDTTLNPENGEISLDVDAGDIPDDTVVTIVRNDSLAGSSFALGVRGGSEAKTVMSYSLEPEGLQLDGPITMAMYWDDVDDNGREDITNLRESKFDIYWYNPALDKWEDQNAVCDLVSNYCSVQISHFSDYALGEQGLGEESAIPEIFSSVSKSIGKSVSDKSSNVFILLGLALVVGVYIFKKK